MAYRCEVCHKGVQHGHRISHSNRHTKRIWRPNIQHVRVRVGDEIRRMYVCTACLKSGRVNRNV
jgi:large subunit ribosomal protein L28